jgi:hypothetical protein
VIKRALWLERLEDRLVLQGPAPLGAYVLPTTDRPWQTTPFIAAPIFADLDGSGQQELLTTASGGRIIPLTISANGQISIWHNIIYDTAQTTGVTNRQIKGTPVVVNLPNGHKGVFAALSRDENNPGTLEDFRVFGWDALTGAVLPGWPASAGLNLAGQGGVSSPLTSADLNGDGQTEIIVTSFSHQVTAFHLDGSVMWRFEANDTIISGAVVGDIDRDGRQEVVFGSDISYSPPFSNHNGGFINILDNNGIERYRYPVNEVVWSSPVLADLNGTGYLDIIVGTGNAFSVQNPSLLPYADQLYALDYRGNPLPGWPHATTSDFTQQRQTYPSVAVADLLGDGHLEVIDVDRGGYLHVIQANGQDLPGWAGGIPISSGPRDTYASPIVADVNGDGRPDIIVSDGPSFRIFDASGRVLFAPAPDGEVRQTAAAVGNMFGGANGLVLASLSEIPGTNQPHVVSFYLLDRSRLAPPWPDQRRYSTGTAVTYSAPFLANFVVNAYPALLHRPADATGFQYFVNLLQTNALTPDSLAISLASSQEARTQFVNDLYRRFLGRRPDPAGLAGWVNLLATITHHDAAADFINTPEFAALGATIEPNPAGSIYLLYVTVLNRAPSSAEVNAWVQTGLPLSTIAGYFLVSPEYIGEQIGYVYAQALPGIPIPNDSAAALVFDYHRDAREETMFASIVSSGGNYAATQAWASWIRTVYRDNLNRDASTSEVASWLGALDVGTYSPAAFVSILLGSYEAHVEYIREQTRALLRREADAGLIAYLVGYSRREDVVAFLVDSPEYFNLNGGTMTGFVQGIYRDLGQINPVDSNTLNQVLSQYNVDTRANFVALWFVPTFTGDLYRQTNAINLLFKYRPEEDKGYLRTGTQPPGSPPDNPDPTTLAAWQSFLVNNSDEAMIAALSTDALYIRNSGYYKGFYERPMIWREIPGPTVT